MPSNEDELEISPDNVYTMYNDLHMYMYEFYVSGVYMAHV